MNIAQTDNTLAAFAIADFYMQFRKQSNSDPEQKTLSPLTSCSSNCEFCYGSSSSQCLKCAGTTSFDGNICQACPDAMCFFCFGNNLAQCSLCKSPTDLVFWNDDTCKAIGTPCDSPFVLDNTVDLNSCISPCSINFYMLPSGTCNPTCDFPLQPRLQFQAKFCDHPCLTGQFLYWDGSCSVTCSYYQRTEGAYKYCDACQPGYYRYDNGVCLPTCGVGFKVTSLGGSLLCNFPCGDKEYLYPDQTCHASCPVSFITKVQDTYNTCTLGLALSSNEIAQAKALITSGKVLDNVKAVTSRAITLISSTNPAAIFMNMFNVMLRYLKYLNVQYPAKLQYILESDESFSINLIPDMPPSAEAVFPSAELPAKFGYYQLPSSFFVNFWSSSVTIAGLLIILGLSFCVDFVIKNNKPIKSFCRRLKSILKWNYILAIMMSYYGDIALFSSFEFRTIDITKYMEYSAF